MPKKIKDIEEYDEDLDEEEEEYEEEIEALPPKSRGRPRKQASTLPRQQPRVKQKRYESFVQQAVEGIKDAETNEVLAVDIWTALADIIERLERIENAIGVMQDG